MISQQPSLELHEDVLGRSIWMHYFRNEVSEIELLIDGERDDTMLSTYFFRQGSQMNKLELEALNNCKGRTLDVGAGAGCHALILQERGVEVLALEQSAHACEVMKARGIQEVVQADVMNLTGFRFDTIILLMNGFGIGGTEEGLLEMLRHLKTLLAAGGRIIGDSTDIHYFKREEDCYDLSESSPCEVVFEVKCAGQCQSFPWIFPNEALLEALAGEAGLGYRTLMYGDDNHFLCELYDESIFE